MQTLAHTSPLALAGRPGALRRRGAISAAAAPAAAGLGSKRSLVSSGLALCQQRLLHRSDGRPTVAARASASGSVSSDDDQMRVVAEKVARAARSMKTLSWVGFWGQLILSTVSAIIIVFSIVFKGVTKVHQLFAV